MIRVIVSSCVLIITLLILNALFDSISGTGTNGEFGKVIEGTTTIVFLYFVIIGMFGSDLAIQGLPFVDKLDSYKSLTMMFKDRTFLFVIECAELISLTFVISFVSNVIPTGFGGSAYTGKIMRSIAVALIGVLINHYFISVIKKTVFFQYGMDALHCFFAGTSLVLTPAMLIGRLLDLDPESKIVAFLVKQLPQTKVGKALSTSTTNSLVFVFSIMIFESQFGNLSDVLQQVPSIISLFAPIVIMIMGFRIMFKAISR